MSGRKEKPEHVKPSPSARMLKKARSFRDDIKTKIIRRTPSMTRGSSPSPAKTGTSPKFRRRGLSRGGSFNEGTKTDKHAQEDDIERLQQKSQEVFKATNYVEDAVSKKIPLLLRGSVTIVLETIMEVNQLLSNFFIDQESTAMLSMQNQVYRSLANLIRWSDCVLLQNSATMEEEDAKRVIHCLNEAMKELLKLSVDKLRKRTFHPTPRSPRVPRPLSDGSETVPRTSLPDIPLTERERKILAETSRISNIDISGRRSDGIQEEATPPPKPPLPKDWESPLMRRGLMTRSCEVDPLRVPPPLPVKRRSTQSTDFLVQGGLSTPLLSPHSNHASSSNTLTVGHPRPHSSSPLDPSPLSQSPSSSVSSALSASSEDFPDDARTPSSQSLVTSPDNLDEEVRFSQYDNMKNIKSDKINDFTRQMNELTTSIAKKCDGLPPALPHKRLFKKNQNGDDSLRICSVYDNLPHIKRDTDLSMNMSLLNSHSLLGMVTSQTNPSMMYSKTMNLSVSQETFSSSETFSSTGTYSSSAESLLQKPPPLPPKQKHVQAYMQMFGNEPQPCVSEYSRHSIHSINHYQAQWYTLQMELFQPLYHRSNTISIMSNISSHSGTSDVHSVTSEGSTEDQQTSLRSASSSPSPIPPLLPPKERKNTDSCSLQVDDISLPAVTIVSKDEPIDGDKVSLSTPSTSTSASADVSSESDNRDSARMSSGSSSTRQSSPPPEIQKDGDSDFAELSTLDDIDVSDQLIRKKPGDDGPEIRGGTVDALIVHATTAGKKDFMYQEAFLTTYRTFIQPRELIEKLLYRYNRFSRMNDVKKKKVPTATLR